MTNENMTPLPWELVHQVAGGIELGYRIRKQGGGYIVATCNNEHATEANAAYIVKAANTAPRLAEALRETLDWVDSWKDDLPTGERRKFNYMVRDVLKKWEDE